MTVMALCPFCGKLPGTKVGPPAMARCIAEGCEGRKLAAVTVAEWNTRPSSVPGRDDLPKPETMLAYASILEKPQYNISHNGIRYKIPTGEVIEGACAALRFCAALISNGTEEADWRTDFENAPSPCIGWCTPPAGDVVRQIWHDPYRKGEWSAHGVTQTVKAWQPLPALSRTPAAAIRAIDGARG